MKILENIKDLLAKMYCEDEYCKEKEEEHTELLKAQKKLMYLAISNNTLQKKIKELRNLQKYLYLSGILVGIMLGFIIGIAIMV